MDPNNEVPLECVPNALCKIYGDKTKGKYYDNGKIANGGMDYVKKMLDICGESAYLDCIDDCEPQVIEVKKGYSPNNSKHFCGYYDKHYSSCFMGQDVKYGWPICNVFDEVETFDGVFFCWFLLRKTF
jgi:hypothetical protein